MQRRTMLKSLAAAPAMAILAGCTGNNSSTSGSGSTSTASSGSLVFDKNNYTTATKTVTTDSGSKSVTYNLYKGITYVANPVDSKYQSLNVLVPVKIDGKAVDASNAPILLDNSIGGYLSSSVTSASGASGGGAPGGGAMPSGGAGPGGGAMPSGGAGAPPNGMGNGTAAGTGTQVNGGGQLVGNGDLALAAGMLSSNREPAAGTTRTPPASTTARPRRRSST